MLTSTPPHHLVVIDCETTGLGSHDRIVEIAALTLDPRTWELTDEYDTLINPERDVGPVGIHGITASMVQTAAQAVSLTAGVRVSVVTGTTMCMVFSKTAHLFRFGRQPCQLRVLQDVVEREKPPHYNSQAGFPPIPDILDPQCPVDGLAQYPARPGPPGKHKVFVLDRRPREDATMQTHERDPLRFPARPAERFQCFLPATQVLDHGSPVTIRPVALQVADNDSHVCSPYCTSNDGFSPDRPWQVATT